MFYPLHQCLFDKYTDISNAFLTIKELMPFILSNKESYEYYLNEVQGAYFIKEEKTFMNLYRDFKWDNEKGEYLDCEGSKEGKMTVYTVALKPKGKRVLYFDALYQMLDPNSGFCSITLDYNTSRDYLSMIKLFKAKYGIKLICRYKSNEQLDQYAFALHSRSGDRHR
jgi:hypothetical protein